MFRITKSALRNFSLNEVLLMAALNQVEAKRPNAPAVPKNKKA